MFMYIDPGTGSMLFTILIGILSAGLYFLRALFIRLKFMVQGGRGENQTSKDTLPLVIFTDSKRYWNTFGPLCRELDRRGKEVAYYTASPDDPALTEHFDHVTCEFIGEGNMAFARMNLVKATMVISSTPSLDVYQWKRSRDAKYYLHVLHAANDPIAYRIYGLDYFDGVLLSGEYQIGQMRRREASRHMPYKDLAITGLPYMDEMAKRLSEASPLPDHPVTVLLAPSWGTNSIFHKYGGTIIEALLKTGYHIVVRPHPQSYTSDKKVLEEVMKAYPASDQLEWNKDNDNFEILRRSDILISDFSGVIFDFSLVFDKPVIYADTSYSRDALDCWDMEEELWTFATLPKIGLQLSKETLPKIKELIDTCLTDPRFKAARDTARDETWQFRGEGTVKTADFILAKYEELVNGAPAPANQLPKPEDTEEDK